MGRQAGVRGSYVVPWEQTETDHEPNAPVEYLAPGVGWRWFGTPVRLDGPPEVLRLGDVQGPEGLKDRAARMAARLSGDPAPSRIGLVPEDDAFLIGDAGFLLTDGTRAYPATLVAGGRLVLFADALPPPSRLLWVVRVIGSRRSRSSGTARPVCFTPGTKIATPWGHRAVESLRPGNRVLTRDDGVQTIVWVADSWHPGTELAVRPELRPVRIAPGALGNDLPKAPLLLSPEHRVLLRGTRARELFGSEEVLVRAADLEDGRGVVRAMAPNGVRYLHLMLSRHQLLWANGAPCDSFHPALADVTALDPVQRALLITACARHTGGMEGFGDTVRRCLSAGEAAILRGHERARAA